MANELQAMVYQFHVKAHEADTNHLTNGDSLELDRSKQRQILSEAIYSFNRRSEGIAKEIEEEIQSFLPPTTTVRVEVRFVRGSIVMMGTVALFSWLGSIALKATKETIEDQLSSMIKIAIQRVFNRVLTENRQTGNPPSIVFDPAEASVTPQISIKPEEQNVSLSPVPARANVQERFGLPALAMWGFLALILLIQLLLLVDRFMVVSWRP